MAEEYRENPDTDFLEIVAGMAKIPETGKNRQSSLFYGIGKNKLARSLELEDDEAKELFEKYHSQVPL